MIKTTFKTLAAFVGLCLFGYLVACGLGLWCAIFYKGFLIGLGAF